MMNYFEVFIILLFSTGNVLPQIVSQEDLNDIATNLNVKVDVEKNFDDGSKHVFRVTFNNKASKSLPGKNWTIYFYSFFLVEPDHILSEDKLFTKPEGYVSRDSKLKFLHENGCLFSMSPASEFEDIRPNSKREITFEAANWAVSKTDIPPHWYIDVPGLEPRVFESTKKDFVGDFTKKNQWKRKSSDRYDPYTPPFRYDRYEVKNSNIEQKIVIPTPKNIIKYNASNMLDLSDNVTIVHSSGLDMESNFLATKTGFETSNAAKGDGVNIYLNLNASIQSDEGYSLIVDPSSSQITITGKSSRGIFYGIQSLLSILATGNNVPEIEITDEPRFEYRGMHIDLARNFIQKDTFIKLMDAMAVYKLNKLHLHLTDDEGWRVEIDGLPELTEIASKRCQSDQEDVCLISQLGSGPDDSTSGSGYLSITDYKDILQYAKVRHIEIIPEVDSPGHARAAIMAMEARFRKYNKTGDLSKAGEYRLIDPDDSSKYLSVQLFNDNAMNPCLESTYKFMDKIVTEIKKMHDDAGHPLKIFHFGGDEVAGTAWINSTACQNTSGESTFERNDLKKLFTQRVANITDMHGLNMAGWEDGFNAGNGVPFERNIYANQEIYSNAWDNVWEWGEARRAYNFANNGYKVIMSHATHLYYDHPYEPDPEERGLYWAPRFTDTFKSFGFIPDSLYENIDVTRMGVPLSRADVCGSPNNITRCPVLNKPENIAGMQGHLWSETVLSEDNFYYMVFPRLLALAERSWHKAQWEDETNKGMRDKKMKLDWDNFANTLANKELKRLDDMGVKYRVPPPGARKSGDEIEVNCAFPGLDIEHSTDNTNWKTGTIPNTGTHVFLRTKSTDGLRSSRVVKYSLLTSSAVSVQSSVITLYSFFVMCIIIFA